MLRLLFILLPGVFIAGAQAQADTTTVRTVGSSTYIATPGQPTKTVRSVGGTTYIATPGQPTIACRQVGETTFCN